MGAWTYRPSRWIAGIAAAGLLLSACGGDDAASNGDDGGDAAASDTNFPEGPITLLVGFGPGGANDLIARRAAPLMSEILGVPISVENMPGASGVIAMAEMMNRDADGYTMVTHQVGTPAISAALDELPFEQDAIELLGTMTNDPVGIAVAIDSPFESLQDLIDAQDAGAVTAGHQGFTQPDGVAASLFELRTERDLSHVAYDSGGEQAAALFGGFIDSGFRAGGYYDVVGDEVRVLAVMADDRSDTLPDVPTVQEAAGFEANVPVRRGFSVPAAVPEEIKQLLADAFAQAANDPRFSEGLVEDINLSFGFLDREEAAVAESELESIILEVNEAGLLGSR